MKTTRVIRFRLKKKSDIWRQVDNLCWESKNLYNLANYIVRQEFIQTTKEKEQGLRDTAHIYNYYDLCKLCVDSNPYKALGSNIGQATLKILANTWKSFFAAIKDWKKNPSKYTGRPKLPGYLDKEKGRQVVGLDSNKVKNKDGYVYFCWKSLKYMNNHFKLDFDNRILSSRFAPKNDEIYFEVIYEIEVEEEEKESNNIASIDLGINNLMTVVTNCDKQLFVINGKPLKSMNAYYNKKKADMQSSLMTKTKKHNSKRMTKLTNKRNNKVSDYLHKASKYVCDWCVENGIDTLVCGHNTGWKQESDMGKKNNQNFVSIPHATLINQLKYKCEDRGIKFIEVNEAYTSGTSFLDKEKPCKENYNKERRKYRGLFVANDGTEINADVNGAYQIMMKAFPNAFVEGIQGVGLHPVIVNL